MTPRDACGRAAPAHLYDEHAEKALRPHEARLRACLALGENTVVAPGMDEGPGTGVRRRLQGDVSGLFSPLPWSFGVAVAASESA
eukprot:747330-Prymnesium_polylepis.1